MQAMSVPQKMQKNSISRCSLNKRLLGPFAQILTMKDLPESGPIKDEQLDIIENGGVLISEGKIIETDSFDLMKLKITSQDILIEELTDNLVLLPGFIDAHTHICYAGSRHVDYARRLSGMSYLDIASQGGGIMDTVRKTRCASIEELIESLSNRCLKLLSQGVTTCEVKSGYGLTINDELKMLRAIKAVNNEHQLDLVATALPAHVCPPEFEEQNNYIELITRELLPQIKADKLAHRADIYIDQGAFSYESGRFYLKAAREMGFSLAIHADQFALGGSRLAAEFGAVSADHLEASGEQEIRILIEKQVIGMALPGASLGLGIAHAPVRRMIDMGMTVAIASDWNPGSAPMGDLLVQACLMGVYEKLSIAETLAGITVHAARALELADRGTLSPGNKADMVAFPSSDFREIIYRQGAVKPVTIWKNGQRIVK